MKVDERLIQQLAVRLREAVLETRRIETAQIQIIGLEAIKLRAGALWPELSARVRETSADFIDQRIGERDFVIPAGDGFVVVYAEPDGAADKCRALQGELNTFYLGDEATKELSASVTHQTLDAPGLIAALSAPAFLHDLDAAGSTPAETPLAVLPVWNAPRQAITGYWIAPDQGRRGLTRYGYDPAWAETGWHQGDKDFLDLDLRILARARTEAAACLHGGRRCIIGYSVHSTTMVNRARRRTFLQILAETPAEIRPLLLGRVSEVQSGTPMATIAEWAHQLRAYSPRMAIQIHHGQRDVTGMQELGISSVACVLPTTPASPTEADALQRLVVIWSRDLKKQNLKMRLDNLEDPRLLGLALDAHVDFCTSPRLWPAVPAPEGMKPFSRDQYLMSLPATAAERRMA
ncbi:MAG TPA: hypothetical protein VGM25_01790 [Caulobacteraceae bacterium]